jgi:cytochrome c oxidase cbb3-type subunit 4
MISGIVTAILLTAFAGITYWAYTARNRTRFEEAAQLPLADEPTTASCVHGSCGCKLRGG